MRDGHLSGAHINPAVTIAFTLTRHFAVRDAAAYITAQLAGATAGALTLLAVWPDQPARLGATMPSVAAGSALVYEIVLTAFLMFVIIAVATDTRAVGAAAAIQTAARRRLRRSRSVGAAGDLGVCPVGVIVPVAPKRVNDQLQL